MANRRDILKHSTIPASLRSDPHEGTAEHKRKDDASKYLILACDGGGMRGYLSSLILQRLQHDLGILGTGNRNIDLYAGTSTGGLIALGLAQGKSIDSVVDLYKQSGAQIFNPLNLQPQCILDAIHELSLEEVGRPGALSLSSFRELWQVLFDNLGDPSLHSVLEGFIPENPRLSSLASKVMVVTFQLADPQTKPASWSPLVIDNFEGSPGADTALYDAALSTAAAPVYFPPYLHPQFGWCSDGGLFANNPAALALGRAIQAGQSLSNIALLSIGTGLTNASISPSTGTRLCFGLDHWISFRGRSSTPPFPLLNAIMDGVSASTDDLCGQLLGGKENQGRYMRVNPVLPKAVPLDDYSPATMEMFEQTAETYFQSPEWLTVEQWIRNNFEK
jgi:uncharacterized protein